MKIEDKTIMIEDVENLVERWLIEIEVAGAADKDLYDDSYLHWINVYLSASATLMNRIKHYTEEMGGIVSWPKKSKGSS